MNKENDERRFAKLLTLQVRSYEVSEPKQFQDVHGYPVREVGVVHLSHELGHLSNAILEGDRPQQQAAAVRIAALAMRLYTEVL